MPKGGKRPGAGRPKGRLNNATLDAKAQKELARQITRELLLEQLRPVTEAQIAHALGVSYMVLRHKDGTFTRATDEKQLNAAVATGAESFRIFTQAPNTQAYTALMDRAFDKPTEHQELSGPENGPLVIKWQDE